MHPLLKALKYLNKYLKYYKKPLLAGFLFIIFANILNVLAPFIVRIAFDHTLDEIAFFQHVKHSGFEEDYRKTVLNHAVMFGGLIVLVTVIRGYFMYLMRQTVIVVSRKIEYDLKNEIYNHYQLMSQSFYRANFTGDLMSRLSEDVSRVRMYLGPAIMYFVNLVFTFIAVVAVMLAVNPYMTLLVLLPLPVLSVSIYYVSKIINRKSDRIQSKLSELTTFVQETMSGIKVLKAFSVQSYFMGMFKEETEAYRRKSLSLTKVQSFFMPLMMLLVGLSTLFVIYFGGLEVIKGSFSFGNIAEFAIYVNLLTWPVASLGWVTAIVQRAEASQARINEFLNTSPGIVSGDLAIDEFKDKIELKQVTYTYPGKEIPAIKDLSMTIHKGQTIGLIGPTGSGKSTLLNMLIRFADPDQGEILIDGVPLKNYRLFDYRNMVGMVPQDAFLFSESIRENILFGSVDPKKETEENMINAAKISEVYHNVMDFPKRFDTILGERGITLSGGQKQRVSIARALIRDPQIVLLDDCLSAVDHTTEEKIISNLKSALKDKTAVIVSHRISAFAHADLIFVMDEGTITHSGNHTQLMATCPYYQELYFKQNSENNE